jgi:hypothetical protein
MMNESLYISNCLSMRHSFLVENTQPSLPQVKVLEAAVLEHAVSIKGGASPIELIRVVLGIERSKVYVGYVLPLHILVRSSVHLVNLHRADHVQQQRKRQLF